MATERPQIPPPEKPIREFPFPDHTEGFFTESVSRQSARYQSVYPIKRGTLYSTVRDSKQEVISAFPILYFLKEVRVADSDQWVTWIWATDENAEDTYNSAISYATESTTTPIYTRVYTVLRDAYEANPTIAYGSALTSLIAIKVTAGGTGYSSTDTVNIAGGGGAAAQLVVNPAGTIISVIVTNSGSGYDSASLPAVTITTSTGSGATLVAIVQPKTAVLVHQEKQELIFDSQFSSPQNDAAYSNQFVRVIRIYETLPGAPLTSSIYEDQLGLRIETTEKRIAAGSDPTPADGTDIIPQTSVVDLQRAIDLAAIQTQLDAIHMQIPTQESISLPPQLIGATVYWGGRSGDGFTAVEPVFQSAGWYSGGIVSQSYGGSASADATVDGDLSFEVRDGFSGAASAILHIFFLPLDATGDDILTKVGAVAWPVFRPTSQNIVVFGRHSSLDVSGKIVCSALTQVGEDPIIFVSTTKTGERRSGGLSTKSIPIPAALCAGISITEEGDSTITASATVERQDPVLTVYDSSGTVIPSPTVNYDYGTWPDAELSVNVEAAGTFEPASIPATTPPSFPVGTYLISSKASLFKYDRLQITAVTVEVTSDMV